MGEAKYKGIARTFKDTITKRTYQQVTTAMTPTTFPTHVVALLGSGLLQVEDSSIKDQSIKLCGSQNAT